MPTLPGLTINRPSESHTIRGTWLWPQSTTACSTPRSGKIAYVGMITTCFDADPDTVEAALGPRDRIVLNTASATCELNATPLPFLFGGLNILRHIVVARFGAPKPSPFFDANGPLRDPIVLTAAQRDALGANPA